MKKWIQNAIKKAVKYLRSIQTEEGYWLPLWFGNPFAQNQLNPIYGTARVLLSLADIAEERADILIKPAIDWLLSEQKADGSWSADGRIGSSPEETAIAILALAANKKYISQKQSQAIQQGLGWLAEQEDFSDKSAPIGLYFARLWYYEPLYKVIFQTAACQAVKSS
jgi:squalene-hopene/tetraprenyl-beta-curcumene cyclase